VWRCATGIAKRYTNNVKAGKDLQLQTSSFTMRKLLIAACLAASLQGQIQILAVVNGASYQPGLPDMGSLATVFCTGLSGIQGIVTPSSQYPLPTQLAGVAVAVNAGPAPIVAIADTGAYQQINIQVPPERITKNPATLSVYQASGLANMQGLVYPATAGLFADGQGFGIAVRVAGGATIGPQNPAHPGDTIAVYGTGFGGSYPPKPVGYPTPAAPVFEGLNDFATSVTSTVAGPARQLVLGQTAVSVASISVVAGLAGVDQVVFQVPQVQPPGVTTLKVVSGVFVCQPPPFTTGCTFQANAVSNVVNIPIQ